MGSYSHIVLDSLMHPDIRPFTPMSDSNLLFHAVSLSALHWGCLAAGVVGLAILACRGNFGRMQPSIRYAEQASQMSDPEEPGGFQTPVAADRPLNITYPRGRLLAAISGVVLFFSPFVSARIFPGFAGTAFFFIYLGFLIPSAVLVLLAAGVWSTVAMIIAWVRGVPLSTGYRAFVSVTTAGIMSCIFAFVLVSVLPRPLPSGSHELPFDSSQWKDPRSEHYVANEITPRQKMLADVVSNVLPGRTREQIEQALGRLLRLDTLRKMGEILFAI